SAYSRRNSIRPGISCSARRIWWRPDSARLRSRILNSRSPMLSGVRVAIFEYSPWATDCFNSPKSSPLARHGAGLGTGEVGNNVALGVARPTQIRYRNENVINGVDRPLHKHTARSRNINTQPKMTKEDSAVTNTDEPRPGSKGILSFVAAGLTLAVGITAWTWNSAVSNTAANPDETSASATSELASDQASRSTATSSSSKPTRSTSS